MLRISGALSGAVETWRSRRVVTPISLDKATEELNLDWEEHGRYVQFTSFPPLCVASVLPTLGALVVNSQDVLIARLMN